MLHFRHLSRVKVRNSHSDHINVVSYRIVICYLLVFHLLDISSWFLLIQLWR